MKKRAIKINQVSKDLAQEAYKSYTGKKDYKRALEIYTLLATSQCVPKDISNFSKSMMNRLGKKIKESR